MNAKPLASWSVLAACYGMGLASILRSDAAWSWYFNADTLNFPSLYRDLFVDHFSIRGWTVSAAPFVFPDAIAYFAIQALVPGFRMALYVFGLLQILALGVGCWWIARSVLEDERDAAARSPADVKLAAGLSAISLGLVVVTLGGAWSRLPAWDIPMLHTLVLPVHHTGAFVTALFGIAWTVHAMRARVSRVEAGVAAVCLAAAVASDRLLVPEFVGPAVLVWGASGNWRRAWRAVALIAGSTLVGVAVIALVSAPEQVLAGAPGISASLAAARQLRDDVTGLQGASRVVSLLSAVGMLVAVAELFRAWKHPATSRGYRWIPALFVVAMPMAVTMAVLGKGLYKNPSTLHYFTGVWVLPIILLPVLLFPRRLNLRSAGLAEVVCAVVVLIVTVGTVRPEAKRPFPDMMMPLAGCLDSLVETRRIQFGVSEYWLAKPVTLFSRRGLRVYQVTPGMTPRHWISNRLWHQGEPGSRYANPVYTFVVVNELDRDGIVARFGEPAERVPCPGGDVWIYNRAADTSFHQLFR
jgi:hypothetical protein